MLKDVSRAFQVYKPLKPITTLTIHSQPNVLVIKNVIVIEITWKLIYLTSYLTATKLDILQR